MNTLRVSIFCLIAAMCWNIAATQQLAPHNAINDATWLRISYSGHDMSPESTVIGTIRRPSIREARPGYWIITFPNK